MNHKKNLFILFVCLLTCGCSSNPFGDYNYKNNDPISYNLKDFTNADGLIIDGKKENEYGEKIHRLYFNNDINSKIYMDSYMYFGEEGLHCFVEVKDNIIAYNSHRKVYYNSSVELFFNDINKTYIDNKTVQYRIAAGGSSTKLCGVKNASRYTTSYFDGQFATKLYGEFNTKTCEGFNVEVFIPWYELGFNDIKNVQGLMFYPAYNRVPSTSDSETATFRIRTTKELAFQATPHTWVPIKKIENKITNVTPEGNFFGQNGMYFPSYGFDMSKDDINGNGEIVLNSRSASSIAFIKDYSGTNYYFETFISDIDGLKSSSPKIGLTTYFSQNRITLYVKKNEVNRCGVTQRSSDNLNWNWTVEKGGTYTNENFVNENDDFVKNGVKLALYRNNDLLCFLVNDELYFANTNEIEYNNKKYVPKEQIELHSVETVDGFTEDSIIGVCSYAATGKYSNYKLLKEEQANDKFYSLIKEMEEKQ